MSLGSIMSVARSALNYQQTVIQTAGHNIANAEVAGYSRQRVDAQANTPQRFTFGTIGTGVAIDDIRRARNALLDVTYRQEAADQGSSTLREELLSSVEGVLGEPSETGLAASMDAFWSSWSDLASRPTSQAARSVVQQRARNVASQLNGFDQRLTDLRGQTTIRLDNTLTELNGITSQIAALNGRIVNAEVGGSTANDLRDQRDLAIDRLAQLGDVRVFEEPDGSQTVLLGNSTLVDGIHAKSLRVAEGTGTTLMLATTSQPDRPLQPVGGELQTMLDFQNVELTGTQEQLDAVANTLAASVNAIHRLGNDGVAGAYHTPFFADRTVIDPLVPQYVEGAAFPSPSAPGVVTARNIGLARAIEQDPSQIATTSSLSTRPADNDIALAMSGLRTASSVTLGGVTLQAITFTVPDRSTNPPGVKVTPASTMADYYRGTTSGLATQVREATDSATVSRTLAEQADQRRLSVSGVNVDEELTTLMRAQQAYAAAAKVITAADEMMQTLMGMV